MESVEFSSKEESKEINKENKEVTLKKTNS
jgi:hypothetical protein